MVPTKTLLLKHYYRRQGFFRGFEKGWAGGGWRQTSPQKRPKKFSRNVSPFSKGRGHWKKGTEKRPEVHQPLSKTSDFCPFQTNKNGKMQAPNGSKGKIPHVAPQQLLGGYPHSHHPPVSFSVTAIPPPPGPHPSSAPFETSMPTTPLAPTTIVFLFFPIVSFVSSGFLHLYHIFSNRACR